jgi:hypothetical protein
MSDPTALDKRLDEHVNILIDKKLDSLVKFLNLDSFKKRGIPTIEMYIDNMTDTAPGTMGGDLHKIREAAQTLDKSLPVTTRIFEDFQDFTNLGIQKVTRLSGDIPTMKTHLTEFNTELRQLNRELKDKIGM